MTNVIVRKLDPRGVETLAYEAELAARLPDGVRLEARWTRPTLPLGYTTFETGDRFVETFYTTRWYNVFEIFAAAGERKGWYCNVAAPAEIREMGGRDESEAGEVDEVGGIEIRCRDLLLDLWVSPDGATLTLDEDEFAADATLDDATRAGALAGLAELERLVAARAAPFEAIRH